MILVELGEGAFEGEFTASDLQTLDEVAGSHEQDAPSVLDEREADRCREMALAGAGRSSDILPGITATVSGKSVGRFYNGDPMAGRKSSWGRQEAPCPRHNARRDLRRVKVFRR